ncbi:MAG TPA: hypothetical protein VGI58_15500 [Streptosporangiaceae bacterium]|jgi:hypothetical protein
MNDDELITAVRESFTDVHSTTPAAQIASRGRTLRARHRVAGVAAVGAAAAAAVAVGVTLTASHLPASHPAASHPIASQPIASHAATGAGVRLAAWTVTRQAGGSIRVSFFRELRDPAALQATLRADGLPASVTFIGQLNPACQPYNGTGSPNWPPSPGQHLRGPLAGVLGQGQSLQDAYRNQDTLVIDPTALPSGAGLQIAVMQGIPLGPSGPWPYPKGSGHPVVEVSLVQSSPQCTGS